MRRTGPDPLWLAFWLCVAELVAIGGVVRCCRGASIDATIQAIGVVESGWRDATGDGGRSIGPLQIQRACWLDSRIPGRYSDCHKAGYSRAVCRNYLLRYEPHGTPEAWARLWNSGPGWRMKRAATDKYWAKIRRAMR